MALVQSSESMRDSRRTQIICYVALVIAECKRNVLLYGLVIEVCTTGSWRIVDLGCCVFVIMIVVYMN